MFKDGDRQELDNYRGIVLSCTVGKVFERVLDERIRAVSEEMVMKEAQGGFRKGRGCADQIFILRSVVELRKEQGLKTVIAFLDVRKAYDTVWREGLWKKMRGYGIAEKLVKWCELFCKSRNRAQDDAVVRGGGRSTAGKCAQPSVLYLHDADLVNELEDSGDGVRVEEAYCGMLMFADDMAMVAESEEGMGRMLDKADTYSRKWRFKFNEKKSKVMVIAGRQRREKGKWWLGNKEMEETEAFKYLGVWMDAKLKGNTHMHMEKRIERAVMETERGAAIWESMGLPTVNFAVEVRWMGTKAQQKKLDAVQEQVGRKILGASRTVASCAVMEEDDREERPDDEIPW